MFINVIINISMPELSKDDVIRGLGKLSELGFDFSKDIKRLEEKSDFEFKLHGFKTRYCLHDDLNHFMIESVKIHPTNGCSAMVSSPDFQTGSAHCPFEGFSELMDRVGDIKDKVENHMGVLDEVRVDKVRTLSSSRPRM